MLVSSSFTERLPEKDPKIWRERDLLGHWFIPTITSRILYLLILSGYFTNNFSKKQISKNLILRKRSSPGALLSAEILSEKNFVSGKRKSTFIISLTSFGTNSIKEHCNIAN